MLYAHIHLYERTFPVKSNTPVGKYKKTTRHFLNPPAPIHIINGVAGSLEGP